MAVISSLFSATISTAQQLHAFQHDTQTLSSALLSSFTANYRILSSFLDALAANESSHYSDISSRAERIHSSQEETLTSLHSQSLRLSATLSHTFSLTRSSKSLNPPPNSNLCNAGLRMAGE